MRFKVLSSGDLSFRGLDQVCADTLFRLPDILEDDDPRVRERLFPATYVDADEEEEWRRHAVPELEHLFASRLELMRKDLKTLRADGSKLYQISIKSEHRSAWLSGLNAARQALFVKFGLTAKDMEREELGLGGNYLKDLALLRIHLLAYMQELMLK